MNVYKLVHSNGVKKSSLSLRIFYWIIEAGLAATRLMLHTTRQPTATARHASLTIPAVEKYSYYELVSTLLPQLSGMRRITSSSVSCLALQKFSTLFPKRHDFRNNFIGHKISAFIFSANLSKSFIISERNRLDIAVNAYRSLLLSNFNET